MKILCKFPTRGRPNQFLNVLDQCYQLSEDKENVTYLVSYDVDDFTMTEAVIDTASNAAVMVKGLSTGKIHACNRDIELIHNWDIIILISDDMVPQVSGWDKAIVDSMAEHYPDLDGVLFFNDGYSNLNTMCIMGRKYYDSFGYIYHPDYHSLWCDNHFMEVADLLGKQTRFDQVLFKHEHWANNPKVGKDQSYLLNDKFYDQDHEVYLKHKANNFGL